MRANVGSADRILRIVLGGGLIAAAIIPGSPLMASGVLHAAAALVGGVLIATALVRFCPLYALFGLSTCKVTDR